MIEEPPVAGPSHAEPTADDWRVTRQTLTDWTYKVLFLAAGITLLAYALWITQDGPFMPGDAQEALGFLNRFLMADGLEAKLEVLALADTEGFNPVLRLKHLAWLGLTGHFSFQLATIINTLLLVLLAHELWRLASKALPGYLLLATGLLILAPSNPTQWLGPFGGRQALGYLLVLWGFAALFDKQDDNALWKAMALLALAACTTERLTMAIPIGGLLYASRRFTESRRPRDDADFVWAAMLATVILADGLMAQKLGLRMGGTSVGLKASVLLSLFFVKIYGWTKSRIRPALVEAFSLSLCLGIAAMGSYNLYTRIPVIASQYAQTRQNPGSTEDRQALTKAMRLGYWHPAVPAAATEAAP